MRLRLGNKHHLRKSADRKAQISSVSGTNAFLILGFSICRFSQVVFIPQAQPHAQSLFLFPIVFGINLIHFFDFFDEKDERCNRKFDRLLSCFEPLSITPFVSAKNANCFEKCNVFGNGKCELSAIQEGRNWGANFWQGKAQNSSPILTCTFLARRSAKLGGSGIPPPFFFIPLPPSKTHRQF